MGFESKNPFLIKRSGVQVTSFLPWGSQGKDATSCRALYGTCAGYHRCTLLEGRCCTQSLNAQSQSQQASTCKSFQCKANSDFKGEPEECSSSSVERSKIWAVHSTATATMSAQTPVLLKAFAVSSWGWLYALLLLHWPCQICVEKFLL